MFEEIETEHIVQIEPVHYIKYGTLKADIHDVFWATATTSMYGVFYTRGGQPIVDREPWLELLEAMGVISVRERQDGLLVINSTDKTEEFMKWIEHEYGERDWEVMDNEIRASNTVD